MTYGISQSPAAAGTKVGICVPVRGLVDTGFMASLLNLTFHLLKKGDIIPVPIFSEAMPIDVARNEISKHAIITKCDYLLWLDSDVILFPATFDHLWDTIHQKDENGNERHIVSGIYYQRALPYSPVIRKIVELGDEDHTIKMTPFYSYPQDKPFVVDGAGMGCVLMKAEAHNLIFKEKKGKPFEFTKRASEDLSFFLTAAYDGVHDHQGNLRKFPLWVDPRVQCAHVGASVGTWHFLHAQKDRHVDIQELSSFTKEPPEVVLQKCLDGPFDVYAEWKKTFGTKKEADLTEEEIDSFYKNVDYRYDLTHYWFAEIKRREGILAKVDVKSPMNVLDYGCGIGDFGISIAEANPQAKVVFYDINEKNLDYLTWRLAHRVNGKTIKNDQCLIAEGKDQLAKVDYVRFNLIFCLDVLEHVKNPEVHAKWLYDHLERNGILQAYIAPNAGAQPQHISGQFKLEPHGFVCIDDTTYVRDDSDLALRLKTAAGGISEKR